MKARVLSVRLAVVAIVAAVLASSRSASAHTVGISRGDYLWKDRTLFVGASFSRQEIASHVPALAELRDADDLLGFEQHQGELGQWLLDHLDVRVASATCKGTFGGMRFDGDGIALAVAYACPTDADALDVDARFGALLTRGHRHMVTLTSGDDQWEAVTTDRDTTLRVALTAPPPIHEFSAVPLFRMGVEHILTGYDHLLFLGGLILIGGPLRSLLAAVTAFTLAHSISLALSTLNVWTPSPRIIEPCIALSIAYVGIENWFVRDGRGRWRLTFLFGLVHGFGFAGALREISHPAGRRATAILAFNLGVETGQITVLLLLLPLVIWASKRETWRRVGMRACTVTIAAAGIVWFLTRLTRAS